MNLLFILLGGSLFAVLLSLGLGLFAMARGGEFAKKYSNRLMQLRIVLQAIAILLFLLAIFALR